MNAPGTWLGIAGVGALAGMAATMWQQIKGMGQQVKALFVVTYQMDYDLSEVVCAYLIKNFKALPQSKMSLFAGYLFNKKYEKKGIVAYKSAVSRRTTCVFRHGFRFLTLADNEQTNWYDLTFIRGTFNINNLIREALEYNNQRSLAIEARFFVQDVFGSLEFDREEFKRDNSNKPDAPSEVLGDSNLSFARKLRAGVNCLVGYAEDELQLTTAYQNKYMTYLAFPQPVVDAITEIEQWLLSKSWYRARGIPWKRGWLLHGKPGCGKSALVRAIGEHYDMPIFVFHLITMTNTDLVQQWKKMLKDTPCVALLEDIDSVFHGRTNLNQIHNQSVLSFDTLLNCIDGIEKNEGILTIITTNDITKVDNALGTPDVTAHPNGTPFSTRPGRIDRVMEVLSPDKECRRKIASIILRDCPHLINEYVQNGEGDTGAQFSERCMRVALQHYWGNKKRD